MTYSKNSSVFEHLIRLPGDYVDIEFAGQKFQGKVDKNSGRIFSLGPMMKYAMENDILTLEQDVTLLYYINQQVLEVLPRKEKIKNGTANRCNPSSEFQKERFK